MVCVALSLFIKMKGDEESGLTPAWQTYVPLSVALRGLKNTLVLYSGTDPVRRVTEIRPWLLEENIAVGPVHEVFTTTSVSTAVFS